MANTYTTQQGDTWDLMAHKVYGDAKLAGWLMQNNFPLLEIMVFDAGVTVQTPEPPESITTTNKPIWRT